MERPWWRSRTVIIVGGCVIAIITFGIRTSFGLFTAPLSELRSWDRETFALAIAVQNLLWGIGQAICRSDRRPLRGRPGAGRRRRGLRARQRAPRWAPSAA